MKKSLLAALVATTCAGCFVSVAQAGTVGTVVTDPAAGSDNPLVYSFTATNTGTLDAYFYGSSAADTDKVIIKDTSTGASVTGLTNTHPPTNVGSEISLSVTAGNTIVFELVNTSTGLTFFSSPLSSNPDDLQHVWVASSYAVVAGIPSGGVLLGFEDESPSWSCMSPGCPDFDYNDEQIVVTDLTVNTTPLPASMWLFGTALGGLGLVMRRRRNSSLALAV
jgi:hypothetical protein